MRCSIWADPRSRPPQRRPMTIKQLQALKPYLKISNIADEIEDLNKHTLLSKVRRGTELTIVESDRLEAKIAEILQEGGFEVSRS